MRLAEDAIWDEIAAGCPVTWARATDPPADDEGLQYGVDRAAIEAAAARWRRFQPVLSALFPSELPTGLVQSPLLQIPTLATRELSALAPQGVAERIFVKADHLLPIAGSIKARGGVYEVLCVAERLALASGLIGEHSADYRVIATPAARSLFSDHELLVASTGNLGYAVGIAATDLGFRTFVHMSRDAKLWKRERLRSCGAVVVEHPGDYTDAVAAARAAASTRPNAHFVDDERSENLFLGYTGAGKELHDQLQAANVDVSAERPLCVYLPCGVGGAPGGVLHALRMLYGKHVLGVFCQPTQSPSMLLRLVRPKFLGSVYDVGLSNKTIADGMAVARASDLVSAVVGPHIAGALTVTDHELMQWVSRAYELESMRLEPAAAAGLAGALRRVWEAPRMSALWDRMSAATHVVWTTGGSRLPDAEFELLLRDAEVKTT